MSATINLIGPSSTPGAPQITRVDQLNTPINAAFAAEAAARDGAVAAEAAARVAADAVEIAARVTGDGANTAAAAAAQATANAALVDLRAIRTEGAGRKFRMAVSSVQSSGGELLFSTNVKSMLMTIPADADYVRFLFRNKNPAGPMTLKGYFAPTAQVGNGWSAYDGSGVAQTGSPSPWVPMNFANAGTDVAVADQPVTSAITATVPNDGTDYWSDWLPITTLSRIDGGSGRLVMVRTQALTNPWGLQDIAPGGITNDPANINTSGALFASSLGISTLTATDFTLDLFTHVYQMQFMSRPPGIVLMTVGTSIMSGTNTTNLRSTWGRIAAKTVFDGTGVPVICFYSNAYNLPPQTANLIADAVRHIRLLKPSVVAIQVSNRNDSPYSAAQANTTWKGVMSIAEVAQDNGAVVILVTATPWSSGSAPTSVEDGYRQINNDLARAFAASAPGFALFDYDAVLTNGASPARLQPAYGGNSDHPNDAGHTAAAAVFAPLLESIIGISGATTQAQMWAGLLASLPTSNPGPGLPWVNTHVLTVGT